MCPQSVGSCSKPTDNTPQTPEILNLISCTNPFDNYPLYQSSSSELVSPENDPSNAGSSPPQSVQHTCSQIIKEGLKLALQTKRRTSYSSCSESYYQTSVGGKETIEGTRDSLEEEEDDDVSSCVSNGEGLTVEDEERRRRRRERNKIAATKCRLKKRQKTVNLVQESEILETQNHNLKSQIQELETQRQRLTQMLTIHKPCCTKEDGVQFSNSETINIPFIQPFQNSHSSSNIHDSNNTDSMSQEEPPSHQMFSTPDSMNLYDETDLSKYDTGQCTSRDLHDLDSSYDLSSEVKDIILPFCASTEALSLGLHYEDESILINNNYDPSLWHRPDNNSYRSSHFQETYRTNSANNNNLVSHYSKIKDSSTVTVKSSNLVHSKQCHDNHDGLLPQ
ncbi:hypothetical protein WDU94_008969 [Cyamophila willieti]